MPIPKFTAKSFKIDIYVVYMFYFHSIYCSIIISNLIYIMQRWKVIIRIRSFVVKKCLVIYIISCLSSLNFSRPQKYCSQKVSRYLKSTSIINDLIQEQCNQKKKIDSKQSEVIQGFEDSFNIGIRYKYSNTFRF